MMQLSPNSAFETQDQCPLMYRIDWGLIAQSESRWAFKTCWFRLTGDWLHTHSWSQWCEKTFYSFFWLLLHHIEQGSFSCRLKRSGMLTRAHTKYGEMRTPLPYITSPLHRHISFFLFQGFFSFLLFGIWWRGWWWKIRFLYLKI